MSDPTDLIGVGVGGTAVGGLVVGLLKALGSRQVAQLDDTLKTLRDAVRDLDGQIRDLREQHVGIAKDIGALQQGHTGLAERINGQTQFYREQYDKLSARVDELARGRKK